MITLHNDCLEVNFINESAQIHSVKSKHYGYEYIHDGVNGWSQQNPILFPMISNTSSKEQLINDTIYHMANHGVVRHAHFDVMHQSEDSITFVKKADKDTLALYPYRFELQVCYTLDNDGIVVDYKVINHEQHLMPFQFGLHPAFKCPLDDSKAYSDYYIEFEKDEHQSSLIGEYTIDGNRIALSHDIFMKAPTVLFKSVNSNWVKLSDGYHGVKVDVEGFDHLAFWTPGTANLLCIEPWYGHGDLDNNELIEFKNRENTICLAANQVWTAKTRYTFF